MSAATTEKPRPPKWAGPNFLGNEDSSEDLALTISEYWQAKSFEVDTRGEVVPGKTNPIFVIRSDMLNGMPRGAKAQARR